MQEQTSSPESGAFNGFSDLHQFSHSCSPDHSFPNVSFFTTSEDQRVTKEALSTNITVLIHHNRQKTMRFM